MRPNSLAFRLVFWAALVSMIILVGGGLLLSRAFTKSVLRSFDESLDAALTNVLTVVDVREDGLIALEQPIKDTRFYGPFSGWYWQVGDPTDLEPPEENPTPNRDGLRSRSLWDTKLPVPPAPADGSVTQGQSRTAELPGPDGQPLRVLAREVTLPDVFRPLTFAVGADRTALNQQIDAFNTTLMWSLTVLFGGLVLLVFVQVRLGLRPLRQMQREFGDIRGGRRAELSEKIPAEIAPLAKELNSFIRHNTRVVERARTHVGNLAHALRTPLSVLKAELSAPSGPGDSQSMTRQIDLMEQQVSRHLAQARMAAAAQVLGARTDVPSVAADIIRTLKKLHPDKEISFVNPGGAIPVFRGERQDLEEILGNLAENACKWGRRQVRISLAGNVETLELAIEDDGPGLADADRERVLKRGNRLDEAVPGSGLGLAIVADTAEAYGGAITLERSALGGLKARVTLPRAPG